jgi:hypothetical protein
VQAAKSFDRSNLVQDFLNQQAQARKQQQAQQGPAKE